MHSFRFSGHLFSFTTDNGVFSKTGIDYGSQVLLDALCAEKVHGDVLDLGCGYGPVGIILKTVFPDIRLTASDVNPRACELAVINSADNHIESTVTVSDGFEALHDDFDLIAVNPPIRAGKKVVYKMFEDSYEHLRENGIFMAVIRRSQGAESAIRRLQEIFGSCETVLRDRGYWVLKSEKQTKQTQ